MSITSSTFNFENIFPMSSLFLWKAKGTEIGYQHKYTDFENLNSGSGYWILVLLDTIELFTKSYGIFTAGSRSSQSLTKT